MNHSSCRLYRPGDEQGIIELYREIFHINMSVEHWQWVYQLPPAGPSVIVVLEHQGQVAGHYAVQPRHFWIAGNRIRTGIAIGTMLRPAVRSVPAFNELAQQAYVECRRQGYQWLYAFPNDQAHRVRCALLKWRPLSQIVDWDGPLPSTAPGTTSDVVVWREMPTGLDFAPMFSQLGTRCSGQQEMITPDRSVEFLKWRFFDQPQGEYVLHTVLQRETVAGYAVTKRYSREGVKYGHLLDFQVLAGSLECAGSLLNSVWRQLAEWEVNRVSCWLSGRSDLAKLLAGAGLTQSGSKTNFCYFDLINRHQSILDCNSAWQVEMTESDRY